MDSKKTAHENNSEAIFKDIWQSSTSEPNPDLDSLGEAIIFIGVRFWQKGMLFKRASDKVLRNITGAFPKIVRTSHPIFVLDTSPNLYHRVCPCTSRSSPIAKRYVRAGCKLKITNHINNTTTFILEAYSFNIPFDQQWVGRLRFVGLVPDECIRPI